MLLFITKRKKRKEDWTFKRKKTNGCGLFSGARIHATLGPYGLAISAPHGFFMGVLIWARQHVIHMGGPIWESQYTYLTDPYGLAFWAPHGSIIGSSYGLVRMGPLWACLYAKAHIHPILGLIGLAIWAHMGPLWACPYGKLVYISHLVHIGLLSGPPMGPLLACLYALVRIGPIRVCPHGLCREGCDYNWTYVFHN